MRDPLDPLGDPRGPEPDAGGGYLRPNQPWVCGNTASGTPCPFGPSPGGACPSLAECRPVQDGGVWRCNRPARRGGPCDQQDGCDGPTADGGCGRVHRCTPVRSLRSTRRRVAVGTGVFLAGVLAMLLGSSRAPVLVAPGPLTHAHARLMNASDISRCANCHPGGGASVVGHAAGALAGHGGKSQSGLCLDCHQKELGREHALLAHGLPAGTFAGREDAEVACATCHQEHQGADHDLAALTNHRCQACHPNQYHDLTDHPDFGAWPYRRRTRIAFDHARHASLHHPQQGEPFACAQCHVERANGAIATLGYQAACASCHDRKIAQALAGGVPVIALPTLDPDALAAAGLAVGGWPEEALGDFDGDLPAPMKLLLAADAQGRRAIDRLGPDFSFFDLDPDNPGDVADAATLADATRRLVAELAREGHPAIARRLSGEAAPAAGLSPSIASKAWWRWFGDLEGRQAEPREQQAAKLAAGGWFTDEPTLSLRYAASGHADPVLTAWLNAAAALPDEQAALRDAALADLNRSGGCLDCHSVEQQATGGVAINWRSLDTTIATRAFTRFDHKPHLTQPELADCRHCHQLTEPATAATPYTGDDPRGFTSHFQPIGKAACVGCHQPRLAGAGCTQCHNYHVDGPWGG